MVWGLDLSQSPQGAGGVGGLLTTIEGTSSNTFLYDGNGNVCQLVDTVTGLIAAQYEYDPYGNSIVASGSLASSNPYRFSTKYLHSEYDLYDYGHRVYNPYLGRWLNRDPIEEAGGINLYAYTENDPIDYFDAIGLKGKGHHIVPWAIFNGVVSKEVHEFLDSDAARIFNDYYRTHGAKKMSGISAKKYNKLVEAELKKFLGNKAIKDITLEEAKKFLDHVSGLKSTHPITVYNNAVRREAAKSMRIALRKAATKAAESSLEKGLAAGAKTQLRNSKVIPIIGSFVAVYFLVDDAQVYGAGPATINTTIDAIPIVGTGKIVAEGLVGYRFLDVTVGKREIKPADTDCP